MLFIIYVSNQNKSREFYKKIFQKKPVLDVPGMTEFVINGECSLGLMPEKGIAKILGETVPDPGDGKGIPRCELYMTVDEPEKHFRRSLEAGAKKVSEVQPRSWGDDAGYVCDPDGHIIAFAKKSKL